MSHCTIRVYMPSVGLASRDASPKIHHRVAKEDHLNRLSLAFV